jgi:hypothetical protein
LPDEGGQLDAKTEGRRGRGGSRLISGVAGGPAGRQRTMRRRPRAWKARGGGEGAAAYGKEEATRCIEKNKTNRYVV